MNMAHPVSPWLPSQIATGNQTSNGPTWITTRKKVSAASPTAIFNPAMEKPIQASKAANKGCAHNANGYPFDSAT